MYTIRRNLLKFDSETFFLNYIKEMQVVVLLDSSIDSFALEIVLFFS